MRLTPTTIRIPSPCVRGFTIALLSASACASDGSAASASADADTSTSGDDPDADSGGSETPGSADDTSGSNDSEPCGEDCGPCSEPDACEPGASIDEPCPWGPAMTRVCTDACEWTEPAECSKPSGWRDMAPASSGGVAPRSEHFAAWTGEVMLVFGGVEVGAAPAAYDPDTNTWATFTEPPSGLWPVWIGTDLVVIGADGTGATLDANVGTWVAFDEPHPLPPRASFAFLVWMPATAEILVWGGYVNGTSFNFADGAAYHVASASWRMVAASPLEPRDASVDAAVVWNGSRVIVYGGGTYAGARYDDAAAYDPIADEWEVLPQCPASGYTAMSVVPFGARADLALVWGGDLFGGPLPDSPAKDGAFWHDATAMWTSIGPMPWGTEYDGHRDGAFWTDGRTLALWGGDGYDANGPILVDYGSLYDLDTQTWTELPPGGPSPRNHAVAVWTGSEAIVWGGTDGTDLGDGKIYRP